jgi:hypothetical protein
MRTMTRTIWTLLALVAVVPSAAAQTDPYPSRHLFPLDDGDFPIAAAQRAQPCRRGRRA